MRSPRPFVVWFAVTGLGTGCSGTEESIDTRTVAERVADLCPVQTLEEVLVLSDAVPATSATTFTLLAGPHHGQLGGAPAVLRLEADLSTVPVVHLEFREERVPDLAARVRSQFFASEQDDLDALEPLDGRDYPACDGLARVGELALEVTVDGVTEVIVGEFTLFEQWPGSATTFEAGEPGRFTFGLRDGDTFIPEIGEIDGARWDIDSPG